jgi:hypothetical protein
MDEKNAIEHLESNKPDKPTQVTRIPYEINTTWWSAVNREDSDEDIAFQVRRFIASRSIALALKGVPAYYTHGTVALPNDHELVKKTGVKRDVNRGMIDPDLLSKQLKDPESKRSHLRRMGSKINLIRTTNRAFHPQRDQHILMVSPDVFTALRQDLARYEIRPRALQPAPLGPYKTFRRENQWHCRRTRPKSCVPSDRLPSLRRLWSKCSWSG